MNYGADMFALPVMKGKNPRDRICNSEKLAFVAGTPNPFGTERIYLPSKYPF
jgi:hypothetical protein